jgi:uncharacterized protein YyaL (SSP411 family)
MPNRLANETSPYLLQHQHNPVDWHPWGAEAIERARREDKPIFLSIGYSACHWCHVMEHESFEDAGIAALLNRDFVSIKVDREERPDLDHIYMNAVQLMTGRGGWPMSMFLTPDLQPFYGGTYWPPHAGRGMPGFDQVLTAVADAWKNRRDQAVAQAEEMTTVLRGMHAAYASDGELEPSLLTGASTALQHMFDPVHGGFGSAPKFPHSMDLQLLLRVWRRRPQQGILDIVKLTLDRMAAGGIYDHLGGGFARYSVDERWLVPHFEKMLYDNALLAVAYLEAYQATGDPKYAQIVRETLDYLARDMTDPAGGIYSTEDADSEGEEGKFYVWRPDEIRQVLGDERGKAFCYVYDVTDEGNFEGHSILNLPKTIEQCAVLLSRDLGELVNELAESRRLLFEVRAKRVRPGRDDKIITSWNALAIDAFARAAAALDEPRYRDAAVRCASFILTQLGDGSGKLLHTWRGGQAKLDAYLDDYAGMSNALVSLYEATFDERWIDEAVRLAAIMIDDFADHEQGGFFYTAAGHEALITRPKEWQDGSTPSGNSLAATALVRLAKFTGRDDFAEAAQRTLRGGATVMRQAPMAAGQLLLALDFWLGPTPEIVIIGDPASTETGSAIKDLGRRFIPNKIVACRAQPQEGSTALAGLFVGKSSGAVAPSVYVCQNFTCQAPVIGLEAVLRAWDELGVGVGGS